MLAKASNRARRLVWVSLLAVAGGCRIPHDTAPAPGPQVPPSLPVQVRPANAEAWPIDPEHTEVTVIVRRAGPLARLGHDHVITSAGETGTVWAGPTPAESGFELQLPVARFDVDLPEARAAAGAEFAGTVPEDARAGTRRNMLRADVLDGAGFPAIRVHSIAASGDWPQALVRVAIELRGTSREFEIPVVVEREPQALRARGALRFNQSDFAITPFAVAGGAIQVADALEVRFEIAARAP